MDLHAIIQTLYRIFFFLQFHENSKLNYNNTRHAVHDICTIIIARAQLTVYSAAVESADVLALKPFTAYVRFHNIKGLNFVVKFRF